MTNTNQQTIDRSRFAKGAAEAAPELLGDRLCSTRGGEQTGGTIIETEAYVSEGDDANHAVQSGRTNRNRPMFGPPGYAYVYKIYGMYSCLNVVCREEDVPEAVLIRALRPKKGRDVMIRRRQENRSTPVPEGEVASGPGKLTMALDISTDQNGMDLTGGGTVWIEPGTDVDENQVITGPRVGIDYAERAADWPLRFWVSGSKEVE